MIILIHKRCYLLFLTLIRMLLYGDEKLMLQLFQNLIGNAIKYRSKYRPKIHISAKKERDKYLLTVNDNGIGISPDYLERIFTIFQRLHTHEEYEGTGIGLAIAQKIVHQHAGQIWAESEIGEGTAFHFTILSIITLRP
jgi:light-regulated signal transduction histidine kinase (bacteriophytochrome)